MHFVDYMTTAPIPQTEDGQTEHQFSGVNNKARTIQKNVKSGEFFFGQVPFTA